MSDPSHRAYGTGTPARAHNRDRLLEDGLSLVRRIAFRMARRLPANVEVDDLIGAGMEGLVKAVDAYDSARHPQFEPYAKARIRGAILDELRGADSLTRYGRSRLGDITRVITRLRQELGREPEEDEVAQALEIPLEQYQKMAADLVRGPALAGAFGVAPDDAESAVPNPDRAYDEVETRRRLAEAIGALPPRQQQVLALYYQEECTQAEVGAILGVTESRVCQILGEATLRLRASLGDSAGGVRKTRRTKGGGRSKRG